MRSVRLLIVLGDPVLYHLSYILSVVDLLVAAFDFLVQDREPELRWLFYWEVVILDATWAAHASRSQILFLLFYLNFRL